MIGRAADPIRVSPGMRVWVVPPPIPGRATHHGGFGQVLTVVTTCGILTTCKVRLEDGTLVSTPTDLCLPVAAELAS